MDNTEDQIQQINILNAKIEALECHIQMISSTIRDKDETIRKWVEKSSALQKMINDAWPHVTRALTNIEGNRF